MTIDRPAVIPARGRFTGGRFHLPATITEVLESRSPSDPGDVIGSFPCGHEDIEEAVMAALRAASPWGACSVEKRLAVLQRAGSALQGRIPELALALQRETGRPPWECRLEARGLLGRLDQIVADAPAWLADQHYQGLPGRTVSRPLGVVAVIGPAMLPLSTAHTHVFAALAAGNAVVFKPSPLCPASSQIYATALAAAELPAGVVNVITGGDEAGRLLASHPRVDGVVFIGATAHGRRLRGDLGERLDRQLVLHLGAKNPAVVLDDADMELAAYEVATSAFQSAGQRCTAISRVLVHEAALDEFLDLLLPLCDALQVGPPRAAVFMGPMLTEQRLLRILALRKGLSQGEAEVLLPGERLDRPGWFLSPSVHLVRQRRRESPYQREELFGPDLAVYPVRDLDDAIQLCDDSDHGLCASLFSAGTARWERFCATVRAGSLFWNRGTSRPSGRMPFGGVKGSGDGRRGGAEALLALQQRVSLLGRSAEAIELWPGTVSARDLRDDPVDGT